MHIWRKRANAAWLDRHSEILSYQFGTRLALIERPGRKSVSVEVSGLASGEARQLVSQFGGTTARLGRDWLKRAVKVSPSKPLRIGARLVIVRGKPKRYVDRRTLIIPAEAAFGTGEHATTAMCLRMLERITRRRKTGWRMLDAGTGSGILAIAGGALGAESVDAIDSDPIACRTAARNARANRVRTIKVQCGDILELRAKEKFDVIAANLFSEVLIAALPNWRRYLRPNGELILSGILRDQEAEIMRTLRRTGFHHVETRRRGKWVALLAR